MIPHKLLHPPLLLLGALLLGAGCTESMVDPPTTGFDTIEQAVHSLVNQHRQSRGLGPLTFDNRIAVVARQHSVNMAAGTTAFGHDGFDERETEISGEMTVTGIAENVAFNKGFDSNPAAQAMADWLNSSGHRDNIEGDYSVTGVGVARTSDGTYYFTQIFVKQ